MDIQYLLFLQNLRESLGNFSVIFFQFISFIPKSPLSVLIPGVLFWCINKRAGLFLLFVASFGQVINQLVKNTFCVYRPWIFDSELQPVQEAMKKASSYSFPSGHTSMATSIYGGLAYFYRKKFPILVIPCAILILLVALSRNFLGVHTPQDVLVAMLEIFIVIILAEKIFDMLDFNKNLSTIAFVAGMIFCVAVTLYFMLKNYPVDYANGKIIVEAAKAKLDSIDKIGCFVGFLVGAFLENKFIDFNINVSRRKKIRRVIVGCIVGGVAMAFLLAIKLTGFEIFYEFCKGFLPFFAVIFLAPLAFNHVEKSR